MTNLLTWQTDPGLNIANFLNLTPVPPAGSAVTAWHYNEATGHLTAKRDDNNKGADYEYDTAGRLAKRTWARGTITDYTYTAWGELDTVNYPGDSAGTRDLDYDYDRIGRPSQVTQNGTTLTPGTNTHTFAYNNGNLLLDTETITLGNTGITRTLDHTQDTHLRPNQHILKQAGGTVEHQVDFTYRAADGRLSTVTDNTATNTGGAKTFTYAYKAASYHLLDTVTGPIHTVAHSYETNRDILTNKENKETAGNNIRSNYAYTTNTLGQRTNVARSGTEMSATNTIGWTYNTRGELSEEDYGANNTDDTRDRAYLYDTIGNRKETAQGTLTLTATPNYTVNTLNQYTALPSAPAPAYDLDGNATSYPVPKSDPGTTATLTWDAENRLLTATLTLGGTTTTTSYEYDYIGRRIGKTTVGTPGSTDTCIYHGWNLCAEYTGTTLKKTYTWGMDLSGSMQGAGGVGGLLIVTDHGSPSTDHYYPTYDGNGNVSEYLDATGAAVAHYEYDAFGNQITSATSGTKANDFAHRFSTKFLDDETALYYYGYRYYDATVGRWINRDPIGERGGLNLYGFVYNEPNNWLDRLGWEPIDTSAATEEQIAEARRRRQKVINDNSFEGKKKRRRLRKKLHPSMLDYWIEQVMRDGKVSKKPKCKCPGVKVQRVAGLFGGTDGKSVILKGGGVINKVGGTDGRGAHFNVEVLPGGTCDYSTVQFSQSIRPEDAKLLEQKDKHGYKKYVLHGMGKIPSSPAATLRKTGLHVRTGTSASMDWQRYRITRAMGGRSDDDKKKGIGDYVRAVMKVVHIGYRKGEKCCIEIYYFE